MLTNSAVKGRVLRKSQQTLLTRSLIVAGISFLLIFAFSFGFYKILDSIGIEKSSEIVNVMYIFSILLIIGSMFMSMYIWTRIQKVSKYTIISCIVAYGIAEGIAFGVLFYAIGLTVGTESEILSFGDLAYCFLFAGSVFVIAGLVGMALTAKTTFTLGKFIMVMSLIMLLMFPVMLIMYLCGATMGNGIIYAIYAAMGLLFIGYIAYDFSVISKMSEFDLFSDDKVKLNLTLMFGFKLLIDFVGLL
jgi:FtsH-binding integral membrane protein